MPSCTCPLCVPENSHDLLDELVPTHPLWTTETQPNGSVKAVPVTAEGVGLVEQAWKCGNCGVVQPESLFPACVNKDTYFQGMKTAGYACKKCCACVKCKPKALFECGSSGCGEVLTEDYWPTCCVGEFDADNDDDYVCNQCCGCNNDEDDEDEDDEDEEYVPSKPANSKPGWEERGVHVSLPSTSKDWKQYWPVPHETTDLAQEMADFYIREFVASNVGAIGIDRALVSDAVRWSVDEGQTQLAAQIAKLDPIFIAYIDMAVGGELRYHKAMGNVGLGKSTFDRCQAWTNWFHIREQVGVDALADAAVLARQFGESTSVLGVKWAVPAEILHARLTGKLDPKTFIDRAFNLQHNGGSLFNKLAWCQDNRMNWDVQHMSWAIGPAHFANPVRWPILLACASNAATALFQRYWVSVNKMRSRLGLVMEPMPRWRDGLKQMSGNGLVFWMEGANGGYPVTIPKQDNVCLFFDETEVGKYIDFEAEYAEVLSYEAPKRVSHDHGDECPTCQPYWKMRQKLYTLNSIVSTKIQKLAVPGNDKIQQQIRGIIADAHYKWLAPQIEAFGNKVQFICGSTCDSHETKLKSEYKIDYFPTSSLHTSGSSVDVQTMASVSAKYWSASNFNTVNLTKDDVLKAIGDIN